VEINRTGSTDVQHLYRGEVFDPNVGFYYLRARWMSPGIGRFVTQDTYRGRSAAPVTLQKYLYANADSVNSFDPSGNMTLIEQMQGISGQLTQRLGQIQTQYAQKNFTSGVLRNLVGDAVEEAVARAIEAIIADIPGASVIRDVELDPDSKSSIDFLIEVDGKRVGVESKFQLPTRSGKGFGRMINQLTTALKSGHVSQSNPIVLFGFKELGARARSGRYKRILDSLGTDEGMLKNAQGFIDLANEIRSVLGAAL
jgi:RHS repeat-associated protein